MVILRQLSSAQSETAVLVQFLRHLLERPFPEATSPRPSAVRLQLGTMLTARDPAFAFTASRWPLVRESWPLPWRPSVLGRFRDPPYP